ncbi:MAG: PspC domain-containing protein [Bacteroidia bacterium]
MKTTVSIHLGGHLMHAEEDAHRSLVQYLESIKVHLRTTEGREEILADIESRFAELLMERWSGKTKVITPSDVEGVIQILGSPMQWTEGSIDGAGDQDQGFGNPLGNPNTRTNADYHQAAKRLFRDGNRRVIGGVSAGLAAYFGLDLALVRIVMLLLGLFTGIGIFAYFVLWVAVPKARTTADRLSMQGSAVTLDSIRRKVEEEYKAVEQTLQNPSNHRRWEASVQSWLRDANGIAAPVLRGLGRLLGVILAVLTFVFLLTLGLGFWFIRAGLEVGDGVLLQGDASWGTWLGLLWPPTLPTGYAWLAMGLVFCGKLVFMSALSVRLLRGAPFRFFGRLLGYSLLAILLGVLMGLWPLVKYAEDVDQKAEITQTIPLDTTRNEWNLGLLPTWQDPEGRPIDWTGELRFLDYEDREANEVEGTRWSMTDQHVYVNLMGVRILPTDGKALLESKVWASGKTKSGARSRSASVQTPYTCDSSGRIDLAEGLSFPKKDGFRLQRVEWTLLIPVGQSLRIDPDVAPYLEETLVVGDLPYSSLAGQRCMMTYNGLVRMGR